MRWLIVLILSTTLARAEGDTPGEFDYWVLALSWSPTWCALEGEARGARQCDRPLGWVLHGLWPQNERGWPSNCRSDYRAPTRTETAAMADIMGSGGSAWHQWRKHGTCSGLSPQDYYRLARLAYERVNRPEVFRKMQKTYALPAFVVEGAFLRENDGLEADMLTITCKSGRIQEARLCLTRDMQPRACGADVVRDCTLDDALMEPMR